MIKKSAYKIPGGKMIKIELREENKVIKDIKITGDFFLYPENGIEILENGLKGVKLNQILDEIKKIAKYNNLKFFGLTCEGIFEAVNLALNNEQMETDSQ